MMKKQMDQNGAPGIIATASGYAMNAKPGPATSRDVDHSNREFAAVNYTMDKLPFHQQNATLYEPVP